MNLQIAPLFSKDMDVNRSDNQGDSGKSRTRHPGEEDARDLVEQPAVESGDCLSRPKPHRQGEALAACVPCGKCASSRWEPWHATYLKMLPAIRSQAEFAFRGIAGEAHDDLVADVVAYTVVAFKSLYDRGRCDLAYPTALARHGILRAKVGRKVGMRMNCYDVTSEYAQRANHHLTVERLDRFDHEEGQWLDAIVEDRHAGPAETAAARIDVGDWLNRLRSRDRDIATYLADGYSTGEAARQFGLSTYTISEKRRKYRDSWYRYQSEKSVSRLMTRGTVLASSEGTS